MLKFGAVVRKWLSVCTSDAWDRNYLLVSTGYFGSAKYRTEAQRKRERNHDCAICYHSSQTAHYVLSLCILLCFSFSLSLPRSLECRAFLFVCSYWALPVDPVPDFPKADINITGHCNGVIFMEAPEEVTWLWLVPWGPGVSIKLVVLTHITINEVEKLRK